MSESRKDVLMKALKAEVGGAAGDLGALVTDDVVEKEGRAGTAGLMNATATRNGYELVGRVENFPSGTYVLWYHKLLER